ncbi:very long chain fatty acid elongase 7-like [Parasteatoda tepidariorum]|uniref:very long chain fatty acid elongase 7-like n=1 Tax=Parasteatoda tepidariorum TaxID=114398 RepID=UPI001C717C5E|nr:elongation of very long chain fatty acids protein-like [Parasteatoda tepidariorum]
MDLRIVYFAIAIYVLLVKLVIPWVMKNRKPFVLRRTLIVYSLLISFLNGLLAYHMFCHLYENWNVRCTVRNAPQEVKNSYVTKGFNIIWYNALMKFMEWFDTIFFALRKKHSQITHLHLIHHTGIVIFPFYIFQLELPNFSYILGSNINCVIHVLMYLYYGLAAIGPHVQKYLWWKKYLTMLQIVSRFKT